MPPTIMYRERIARWIRTRRSRARFNELGASVPTRSSADCITIMSEFEFSAHTGGPPLRPWLSASTIETRKSQKQKSENRCPTYCSAYLFTQIETHNPGKCGPRKLRCNPYASIANCAYYVHLGGGPAGCFMLARHRSHCDGHGEK